VHWWRAEGGEVTRNDTGAAAVHGLQRRLDALRRDHPARTVVVGGVTWRYTAVGKGPDGLMLFPGAVGGGDVYFALAPRLAHRYRLIMITLPRVSELEELMQGLEAILAVEKVDHVAMVGSSFGGMVAQAFLFRHPERTTKVVLSATAPPRPGRADENERWHRVLRAIPMPLLRTLLRLLLRAMFKKVTVEPDFWRRFYFRAIADLTRADLECRYRLALAFDRRYLEAPDLSSWAGQMLVVLGNRDRMIKEEIRGLMRSTYPRAREHRIDGAGHGPYLERPEEWLDVVTAFLTSSTSSPSDET
jgi:pimeloyl-ACP methyl ester carboxylesterase